VNQTWSRLCSPVAFLPGDDIHTDTIIPQTEVVSTGRTGLAAGLFASWRYDEQHAERPEFVLNQPAYRNARILAVGRNFGCGSSREHAVSALAEFGIRCVLALGFAPIFQRNCLRSRIAPLTLPADRLDAIAGAVGRSGQPRELLIDLRAATLSCGSASWPVDLDGQIVEHVVNGLDEIDRTGWARTAITCFERSSPTDPISLAASASRHGIVSSLWM